MAQIPFDAVLFDLDGVLTSTSALHAACWKRVFEEALGEPFDAERDCVAYVDGKPREDGIRDFLRSRGVDPDTETVRRIGARKQALVERSLAGGVEPYDGSVRWVEQLRRRGVRTAVVSSSANCRAVLCAAGIAHLFELTVDGSDVERLGLRGKPAPDAFLEAAARMRVAPQRSVVVEDALAGVAAGRAAGFGQRHRGRARRPAAGAAVGRPTPWSATSGSWRNDARVPRLDDRGAPVRGRRERVGVRGRQRLPRRARRPGGGCAAHDPGVVLNGFHETWPIVYPEDANGLARTGQTIAAAPDALVIRLLADDEPFDLGTARVIRFERVLDMRGDVLWREAEYETARGRRMVVRSRRLASLADRHLAAMEYEVVALDGPASVVLSSELVTRALEQTAGDPRRGKGFAEKGLVPLAARAVGGRAVLRLATRNSGLELACGIEHHVEGGFAERAPKATQRASSSRPSSRPASRCGSASTSPTTGRAPRPPATLWRALTARSIARRAPGTPPSSVPIAVMSRTSGGAATIQVRGQPIEVDMTHHGTTYRLLEGRGIRIQHHGEELRRTSGAAIERPVRRDLPRAA